MREIELLRKATYSLGDILSDRPLQAAPRVLIGDTTFQWLAIINIFVGDSRFRLARYDLVYWRPSEQLYSFLTTHLV